jgi:hypothetical protein
MFYARVDTDHGAFVETRIVRFCTRADRDLWVSQRPDRAQPIRSRAAASLTRWLGVSRGGVLFAAPDGSGTRG